uniref:Apple domain-containing protein n=1 Tax=Cyprinodon variegatus TaxID=28743 RepID=A0A3Q2D1Y0_CYPVA
MYFAACQTQLLTYEGVDFFGSDFRSEVVRNADDCQQTCTQNPNCQFFTYITESFPFPDIWYKVKKLANAVLPCFPTKESYRDGLLENIDFPGSDITFLYSPSVEHCQRLCTEHHSCLFFTFIRPDWTRDNRYKCHLKFSWNIPRTPIVEKKTGVTSGFALKTKQTQEFPTSKQITSKLLLFPNTDIPGSNIEKLKSVSPEHCQVLCSANPQCTYFSFSSDDFSCYLKNNQRVLTAKPKKGTTSGIPARFCQLDDNWVKQLYQGVDFRGSDFEKELMDDAELCQRKCDEDATCQFFTYVDQTFSDSAYWRRCYLKRVITMPAPPRVNKLHNAVSGFNLRNCQGVFV